MKRVRQASWIGPALLAGILLWVCIGVLVVGMLLPDSNACV